MGNDWDFHFEEDMNDHKSHVPLQTLGKRRMSIESEDAVCFKRQCLESSNETELMNTSSDINDEIPREKLCLPIPYQIDYCNYFNFNFKPIMNIKKSAPSYSNVIEKVTQDQNNEL